jgi:hypothetical protein
VTFQISCGNNISNSLVEEPARRVVGVMGLAPQPLPPSTDDGMRGCA